MCQDKVKTISLPRPKSKMSIITIKNLCKNYTIHKKSKINHHNLDLL